MALQIQLIDAATSKSNHDFQPAVIPKASTDQFNELWLQQYFSLRDQCFKDELGIESLADSQDQYDQSGYLLLLLADDVCIGGARLNDNGFTGGKMLPLEESGFSLRQAFPSLNQPGTRYGQWTRLVVHPEFRTMDVLKLLSMSMAELTAHIKLDYCFNISGSQRSRLYRKLHMSHGIRYEIRPEVSLPVEAEFAHLEHLFSIEYGRHISEDLHYSPTVFETDITFVEDAGHSSTGSALAVA